MKKVKRPPTVGLIEKLPIGALTLATFHHGQEQWKSNEREHIQVFPDIRIIQLQLGHHEVHSPGRSAVIQAGNSYLIEPHTPVRIITNNDPKEGVVKYRWILLSATIYQATDLSSLLDLPLVLDHQAAAKFSRILDQLCYKNDSRSHVLWKTIRDHELGITALRTLCEISKFKPHWQVILQGADRLRGVLAYINKNLERKISPAKMAALSNLSRSQFHAIFREKMGKTPLEYLRQIRLIEASRQLVVSDDPLRLLAERTGFYNEFHFSRDFKKYFKVTPSAYRQTHRPRSL